MRGPRVRTGVAERAGAAGTLIYAGRVPELPEVEIAVRRLDAALRGAEVESALAPGWSR